MILLHRQPLASIAGHQALTDQRDRLLNWVFGSALPLQCKQLLDPAGGYHERLSSTGEPVDLSRRARVSARQVYVFATAARLGWDGPAHAAFDHAMRFLTDHHISAEGDVIPVFDPKTLRYEAGLSLYDVAFILFALASAQRHRPEDRVVEALAERVLGRMISLGQHAIAGYEDGEILRSNPHMHLLEAALAWIDVGGKSPRWTRLATEIVALCQSHFIDPVTGAVRELFDRNWQPLFGGNEAVIEPGHQYEWAWLLLRWEARSPDDKLWRVASRLIEIGQTAGLSPSTGLVVNRLTQKLKVADPVSRLWPQTERIKALSLSAGEADNAWDLEADETSLTEAVAGLMRYTDHPVEGSWWENIDPQGHPLDEPARTSSLYHIMGAAEALVAYSEATAAEQAKA